MKKIFKQFDFKKKKYAYPTIIAPVLIIFLILFSSNDKETTNLKESSNISVDLGGSEDIELKDKRDSYKENRVLKGDNSQSIAGLEDEKQKKDSLYKNEIIKKKRDSIFKELEKKRVQAEKIKETFENASNISEKERKENLNNILAEQKRSDLTVKRKIDSINKANSERKNNNKERTEKYDPVSALEKQMAMIDSIKKKNDPDYQRKLAEEKLQKEIEERKDYVENSTLKVSKEKPKNKFNSTFRETKSKYIKAIIDENIKVFLGSRVRIRVLENIYVGNMLVESGSMFYSIVDGFDNERIKLKIVSILIDGEIYPVSLDIYDLDGLEGLYIPNSQFREITKTLGSETAQGSGQAVNQMNQNQDPTSTLINRTYQTASNAIAKIVRKQKAKLKYNTHVYLIDVRDLKEKRDELYNESKK